MKTNQPPNAPEGQVPKINFLHVVDIVLFLLIILSLSITIVVFGGDIDTRDSSEGLDATSQNYLDDYAIETNEVLLASTIPVVSYVDSNGNETVFAGYSVNQLILEDLYLRQNLFNNFNLTSLEMGIETEIGTLARNLIDPKYMFVINITSYSVNPLEIIFNNDDPQNSTPIVSSKVTLWSLDQGEELEIKLQLFTKK